jgi:hypothetical protein
MKKTAFVSGCLVLFLLTMVAGCSDNQSSATQNMDPNSRYSATNNTYSNYNIAFE